MRAAIFAFLFTFFVATHTVAMTEERLPVACDTTKKVLDQLKKKQYSLILMGEVDSMQTMIFLNPENDMVVGVTVQVDGSNTTCIFVAGEKNAVLFDLPKTLRKNEKDL